MTVQVLIPTPALVVLIGLSGSGKSTWAEAHFRSGQVLSVDAFRALTGNGPDDQTAGREAFALLDHLLTVRLSTGLTTVIDTTGLDGPTRSEMTPLIPSALVVSRTRAVGSFKIVVCCRPLNLSGGRHQIYRCLPMYRY